MERNKRKTGRLAWFEMKQRDREEGPERKWNEAQKESRRMRIGQAQKEERIRGGKKKEEDWRSVWFKNETQ